MWRLPSPSRCVQVAILAASNAWRMGLGRSSNRSVWQRPGAQLTGNSTKSQLVRRAPVESRLNGNSNASWFTPAPVIDADGIATGLGTRGTGILDGPLGNPSISRFRKLWCCCGGLQHAQPSRVCESDINLTLPSVGVISSRAVNARLEQLMLNFAL